MSDLPIMRHRGRCQPQQLVALSCHNWRRPQLTDRRKPGLSHRRIPHHRPLGHEELTVVADDASSMRPKMRLGRGFGVSAVALAAGAQTRSAAAARAAPR